MSAHDMSKYPSSELGGRFIGEPLLKPGEQHLTFPADTPASTPEDQEAARQSTESDSEQKKLQAEADLLRARLSQTLESLGSRKHTVENVAHELTHSPVPLIVAGAGAAAAVVGAGLLVAHHRRKQLQPPLRERLHEAAEAFRDPQHASHAKERPLSAEIARAAAVSVSSFLLTQLVKYGLRKLGMDGRPEASRSDPRDLRDPRTQAAP